VRASIGRDLPPNEAVKVICVRRRRAFAAPAVERTSQGPAWTRIVCCKLGETHLGRQPEGLTRKKCPAAVLLLPNLQHPYTR
jgi:hypothetical protein